MSDEIDTSSPERIWAVEGVNDVLSFNAYDQGGTEYIRADLYEAERQRAEKAEAERDEARRRRDEWRAKAEGYDEVRRALREKVGAPWPPNMSRILWAGIAADEKQRADDAEAEVARLRLALEAIESAENHIRGDWYELADWQRRHACHALRQDEGGE